MDEEDGGVGLFGEDAQAVEDGIDGGGVVLVGAAQEAGEGVDDEQAALVFLQEEADVAAMLLVGEVVDGQGLEVERGFGIGVVGDKSAVDAVEEARAAGFKIDEEDGSLDDGAAEPRLAGGDADGEIEAEEGLLGARVANEDVEAGAGEEAGDEPFELGRRAEGFSGAMDLDVVEGAMGKQGAGGLDCVLDGAVLGIEGVDEGEEGLPAGIAAAGGIPDGIEVGQPGFRQRGFGYRRGAEFKQAQQAGCGREVFMFPHDGELYSRV